MILRDQTYCNKVVMVFLWHDYFISKIFQVQVTIAIARTI